MGTSLLKVAFLENLFNYCTNLGSGIQIAVHSFIQEDCLPVFSPFTFHITMQKNILKKLSFYHFAFKFKLIIYSSPML